MGRGTLVAALREQRRVTLDLLAGLDEAAWEQPCLPPWRVRDVVTHLIALDSAAVTGRLLPFLRTAKDRRDIERWNEQVVGRAAAVPSSRLLEDLERVGARLATVSARIPRLLWRIPVRTVFGRHPLHFLLARRVLDEWVHSVDVARAAGLPEPRPVPHADVLAPAVLDALPALALSGLDVSAGVVRLVARTGELHDEGEHEPRRTWGIDFARRHYGPRVTATPDATVRLHAAALALLVEGREVGGYGPVLLEGDEELARRTLAGLAPAG
jgi:uncharacterized protein (TIGR03083 family)